CALPEFASFLALFDPARRAALTTIYEGYLAVARDFALPIHLGTPTWPAHPDCLARLGFAAPGDAQRVNAEAVAFLRDLRARSGLVESAYIAGVIGPRRDGYDPADAPGAAA